MDLDYSLDCSTFVGMLKAKIYTEREREVRRKWQLQSNGKWRCANKYKREEERKEGRKEKRRYCKRGINFNCFFYYFLEGLIATLKNNWSYFLLKEAPCSFGLVCWFIMDVVNLQQKKKKKKRVLLYFIKNLISKFYLSFFSSHFYYIFNDMTKVLVNNSIKLQQQPLRFLLISHEFLLLLLFRCQNWNCDA